jgi:poly(A) polymerase
VTAHLDVERLRRAPWLKAPALQRVFAALATTGKVSRAVGGAVRNTLLGEPIDDVDIATAATPDEVIAVAKRAGLTAIPTGLQHGTVTLVADRKPFEVTTLRCDIATDGRHATVAFTEDWALDASRRDFTINALYCDADGTLFDPLGGAVDLVPTRVRFIGDPRARIREDYLRILRFFRFSARYNDGTLDQAGQDACAAERHGFSRVSAERIRAELLKILATARAPDICRAMQASGFLVPILGAAPSPSRLQRLLEIETFTQVPVDPLHRLAALALYPSSDVSGLARRLRLSNDERKRLGTIAAAWGNARTLTDETSVKHMIYRHSPRGFNDTLMVAWAGDACPTTSRLKHDLLKFGATWRVPKFPIAGPDVMALGVAAGPTVGRCLGAIEAWWQTHDFSPDRQACLDELARRMSAS